MAGEKAKENKTLVAQCEACGKAQSVELMSAVLVGTGRARRLVNVCEACRAAGWTPPEAPAAA